MQIPVLIESDSAGGFRARGGEPFPLVVEGATPQDALAHFKDCIEAKLRGGMSLASVEIQSDQHPWLPFAGMFPENDPIVLQWLDTIRLERESSEESE